MNEIKAIRVKKLVKLQRLQNRESTEKYSELINRRLGEVYGALEKIFQKNRDITSFRQMAVSLVPKELPHHEEDNSYEARIGLTTAVVEFIRLNFNFTHRFEDDKGILVCDSLTPMEVKDNKTKEFVKNNTMSKKIKGHTYGKQLPKELCNYLDLVSKHNTFRVKEVYGSFPIEDLFDLHTFTLLRKDMINPKAASNETYLQKKVRFMNYAAISKGLAGTNIEFNVELSGSNRDYQKVNYGYIVAYGNHFESRVFEGTEKYIVSTKGLKRAKQLLMSEVLKKKVTVAEGIQVFNRESILEHLASWKELVQVNLGMVDKADKFGVRALEFITPNELGDTLYKIELAEIALGIVTETAFLSEWDMVNDGGVQLANFARTPQMMSFGNLKTDVRRDSHTDLTKAIENKDGRNKSLSAHLLHGGRIGSLSKKLGLDSNEVTKALEGLMGDMAHFPNEVSMKIKDLHLAGRTVVEWSLPDGTTGFSTGYSKNNDLEIIKGNGKTIHLNLMMPIKSINGTTPVSTIAKGLNEKGTQNKAMGTFAIMIHNMSNAVLRRIIIGLAKRDIKAMTILDKYKLSLNSVDELYEEAYNALEATKEYIPYVVAQLNQQLVEYGLPTITIPTRGTEQIHRNEYILSA